MDVFQFTVCAYSRAVSSQMESGDLPVMLAINHEVSVNVVFELLKASPGALAYMKEYFAAMRLSRFM